jgi:hypothetical protein
MHLRGLRKARQFLQSEDGYVVTEAGKKAIGFPKIDQEMAQKILSKTFPEEAFYFYTEPDHPAGISSDCLSDFCEKIRSTDINSIEFHLGRGDFASWIKHLGDDELGERVALIQETDLAGDALRETLYQTIKTRYGKLTSIASL